ncbi:MAG: hypothetical protein AAF970_06720 [Bacteroidota bacterium]
MKHALSSHDQRFRAQFEAGHLPLADFSHRAHIRLAYAYLAEHDYDTALTLMRSALQAFLHRHGVDPSKYHETMTGAWLATVQHVMAHTPTCHSAAAFIAARPTLLDAGLLMKYYTPECLFSQAAREQFVEPNLERFPWSGA